jgi:hypothetical protein
MKLAMRLLGAKKLGEEKMDENKAGREEAVIQPAQKMGSGDNKQR